MFTIINERKLLVVERPQFSLRVYSIHCAS